MKGKICAHLRNLWTTHFFQMLKTADLNPKILRYTGYYRSGS